MRLTGFRDSYCEGVNREGKKARGRGNGKMEPAPKEAAMRRYSYAVLAGLMLLVTISAGARVRTGRLGGVILHANGKPATEVAVVLERSDGSKPLATRTNSEGAFVFRYIRPGLYDVRAGNGKQATVWKHNVMVHAGRETQLSLHLELVRPKRAVK